MEYKYKAFISYRHVDRDSAAAEAVHTAVEHYVIPKKLRRDGKKRPGKVFRDEEELRTSSDLSADICEALDQSEYLIVICSPDTLDSKWVPKEIAYFREHRDQKNILTVLTGGDPGEIFPALMPGMPEPLFLDLIQSSDEGLKQDLKDRFGKLCARLLDCEYDDLVRRDEKRRRGQLFAWMGGIAAVAAVIIGILSWSYLQIDGKNRELEQQNNELLLRDSEIQTMNALEALDDGDRLNALSHALSALPSPERDRPYYAPAERAVLSALQPFREAEKNCIFSRTTMEQTTSIQDLCVSTDGKQLVTADGYHTLRCFDTVTGSLLWERRIAEGKSGCLSQLFLFASYGSVVYCNGSTVASVSLETGEILWRGEGIINECNLYIPCEEAGYLATVTRYYRQSTDSRIFSMTIISLLDGTVTAAIPIVEGANRAHFDPNPAIYFPEIDNHDLRPYTVCSGGRYIIGTYCASRVICCYFCVDTQEQTCTDLYESVCFDDGGGDPYALELIDEGRSLLVVVGDTYPDDHTFVQRISLEDRSLLWKKELLIDGSDGVFLCLSSAITLAADDKIFQLDPENGETDRYLDMDASIKDLTMVDDSTYALLLEDGRTTIGWFDWRGFHDIGSEEGEQINLGSCSMGRIWNSGSIRMEFEDGEYKTFRMTDEDSGGGFAVTVPDDSGNRVIVHRPKQLPVLQTGWTTVLVEDTNTAGFQLCGQDGMVFFNIPLIGIDFMRLDVVDPTTLEMKSIYLSPWALTDEETLFLPDGSSFLVTDNPKIKLFLPDTMSFRLLSEAEEDTVPDPGGDPVPESSHAVSSVRLSGSGDILSAAVTDTGLFLWRNGSYLRQVEYPLQQEDPEYWSRCNMIAGANGSVAIWYDWDDEPWTFYIYDVNEHVWRHIQTDLYDSSYDSEVRMGSKEPIMAVFMSDGTIKVFDILTGAICAELSAGFSSQSVWDVLLCRNDTAIAVYADGNLYLYDITSGRMVFSAPVNWDSRRISCYEDPEKHYLFFGDNTIDCEGIWVSTEDWRILSEISNFLAYNDHTDTIFRLKNSDASGISQLYASSFPTTEELVAMGKEFLGE